MSKKNQNPLKHYWIDKGQREGWIKDPQFTNQKESQIKFPDYGSWHKYGLEQGFDKRYPASLLKSPDLSERVWYAKGRKENWTNQFPFTKKQEKFKLEFLDNKSWYRYGLDNQFNKRNSISLQNSENLLERSWYNKGQREKWLKDFPFRIQRTKNEIEFSNYEIWSQYGIDNEFDKTNPASLVKSTNPSERYWIRKGQREGWTKDFQFARKYEKSQITFPDHESWYQYGIEHGFKVTEDFLDKRPSEPVLYVKGRYKGWIKDFPSRKTQKTQKGKK